MSTHVLEQTSLDDFREAARQEPGIVLSRLVALARATGRRESPPTGGTDERLPKSFGDWGEPLARAIVTGEAEGLDRIKRAELEMVYRLAGV